MAADLGGSQISALLESVPGIRNVLRSPVADAMVNMIRAAAGLQPFDEAEADELIQYAVRRGLINAAEGERVLAEARAAAKGRRVSAKSPSAAPRKARPAAKKTRPAAKKARPAARKPVKKAAKKKR